MVFCFLLLTIFIIFSSKKETRNISNPSIAFALLWFVVVFLANLRLFDLYKASELSYAMIFVGVLMFYIGGRLSEIANNICLRFFGERSIADKKLCINYKILYFAVSVCIIYYLPQLLVSVSSMLQGINLNEVRDVVQEAERSTGLANLVGNYIILPLSMAAEPLGPFDYWLGKRDKKLFVLVLLLVLVRTFGDGGRTPLFNIVVYFIMSFLFKVFYIDRKNVNKKEIKVFLVFLLIGVLAVGCVTLMRANGSLIRKAYFYFAMSPVLLTRWVETVNNNGYFGKGLISFNGFFYLIDYLRKNIFMTSYNKSIIDAYELIASTDSTWLGINSTGSKANAYVSCFWFFYADARFIGVLVFSCVYGFLAGMVYHRAVLCKDPVYICMYLLLFQGVCFSFIRFPFAKAYYIIAFLVIRFLFFKRIERSEQACMTI